MTDTSLTDSTPEDAPTHTPLRLGIAVCLAGLAGVTAQTGLPGSVIALIPAGLLLLICSPLNWKGRSLPFKLLLGLAVGITMAIAIEPGPLNLALAWLTFALLVFATRSGALEDLLKSCLATLDQLIVSPAMTARSARKAHAALRSNISSGLDWRMTVLPVLSAAVFTLLFVVSNTTFSEIVFRALDFDFDSKWLRTALIFAIVLQLLLTALAMTSARLPSSFNLDAGAPAWHEVLFSPGSVIATLAALNAVFLLQNVLDAQHLWSGLLGTPGYGYARYAQKGAFTLIITVLLAAGLMILSLWPGTRTNASLYVRLLVFAWAIQNGFLLASCTARLYFYVDAYGLTLWRLASLIWMGLIGCGLVLVALRILWNRSNLWLVNANLAAAFLVLWASCFADFRGAVAQYNVSAFNGHNSLDLQYMFALGPHALPALSRIGDVRKSSSLMTHVTRLEAQQSDWRSWTVRGAIISKSIAPVNLPAQRESGMLPECQTSRPAYSSNPSPSSSGTSLPGAGCPAPSSPYAPR
jgi:hypothetical protein